MSNWPIDDVIRVAKTVERYISKLQTKTRATKLPVAMENLAYLYILAEEAELSAKSKPQRQTPIQGEQPVSSHRSSSTASIPAAASNALLECDREHQPYPTFYL